MSAILNRAIKALAEVGAAKNDPRQRVARPEPEKRQLEQRVCAAASLETQERFGQSHARLFSFIRKRVWTPAGPGVLLSAFAEQCEILPDGAAKTIRVRTEDVRPIQ